MGIIILEFYNELYDKTTKEFFYSYDTAKISAKRLLKRDKISNVHIYSLINGHKEELPL